MLQIQIILTLFILVMFFVKFRIGVCLYIAYFFLVPYCKIPIAGIELSWNFVNFILLLAYLIDCSRKENRIFWDWKPFASFIVLYILFLLEILFQNDVPIDIEFRTWRQDVFNLILPMVIWNAIKYDNKLSSYIFYTLCVTFAVVAVYGLFLISLDGVNPYVMMMAELNNAELQVAQFGEQKNRILIKISSVFSHPMIFGLVLGLALVYMYSNIEGKRMLFSIPISLCLVACIFFCGIRTPIAAFAITIVVFLIKKKSFKILILSGMVCLVIYYTLSQIPALSESIISIFQDNNSNVEGSSLQMRIKQLNGCFIEVRNCLLFGKGYGYSTYYMSLYGTHPIILAFESLIFVILCNNGIVGFAFWGYMFRRLYKDARRLFTNKEKGVVISMLIVYFIVYTIITGLYDYMKFFILFYSLILAGENRKQLIK